MGCYSEGESCKQRKRKKWRYPGVPIPARLQNKYWDHSKGTEPK